MISIITWLTNKTKCTVIYEISYMKSVDTYIWKAITCI